MTKGFFHVMLAMSLLLVLWGCSKNLTQNSFQASFQKADLASTSPSAAGPDIFFTDITSGPNVGGENTNGFSGAYVSLYGNNFGPSQGASTITLNGSNCARVVSWGTPWLWYQKIVIQLGAECTSGNFIVNVGGATSNPVPFTVRAGNIYCVSTAGNDSNKGVFGSCWSSIQHAVSNSPAYVSAGDIVYVEDGVNVQPGGEIYDDSLTLGVQGTASSPIALIACPSASATSCGTSGNATSAAVTIGTSTGDDHGILTCSGLSGCTNGAYWTVAGLTVRAVCEAVLIGTDGNRFVANDISTPNCVNGQSGSFHDRGGANIYSYGNYIHDISTNTASSVTKLHHAMYVEDGSHAVYYGWNEISNNQANRGIQVYTSTPGTMSGDIYDIHIHDNVIHDSRGVGILFNEVATAKGPIEAYNNVVYNAGRGPDFTDGTSAWDCMESSPKDSTQLQVYNNTLYNCGYLGGGQPASGMVGIYGPTNLRNNIFYNPSPFIYFDYQSSFSGSTCSNNLYYGSGAPPSPCATGAITANPLFVNLSGYNFHLQSTSPAIDVGIAIASLLSDIDGVLRPQGAGYDIGAYEYASGYVTPSPMPSPAPSATPKPSATPLPSPTPTPNPTPNPTATPVDHQAPTTSIISPVDGAVVPMQTSLLIKAKASSEARNDVAGHHHFVAALDLRINCASVQQAGTLQTIEPEATRRPGTAPTVAVEGSACI